MSDTERIEKALELLKVVKATSYPNGPVGIAAVRLVGAWMDWKKIEAWRFVQESTPPTSRV